MKGVVEGPHAFTRGSAQSFRVWNYSGGCFDPWGSKADCERGEKVHCGLYYAEHFSVSLVAGISGGSFVPESLERLYKVVCKVKDLGIPV